VLRHFSYALLNGFFRPIIKEVVHKVSRIDDSRLASLFAREVLADVVGRELLSPEWAERMDYLEFIARTTSHIPDKGQVTVRYYGLHANAQFSSITSN
jgi:hypothetical protein